MDTLYLQSTVDNKNLIDFGLFTVIDSTAVNTLINLSEHEASDKLINLKLKHTKWLGYSKNSVIGYNGTVGLTGTGLTEAAAYTIWIEEFKDKERRFKKQFPLNQLSQSQYDAMLSLYVDTGTFINVGTELRKFQLLEFISEGKWDYVATALTLNGVNRIDRQAEAKLLMLGDYGTYKKRSLIKEDGIKTLLKEYSTGQLNDEQKKQAEYVYYAETSRFLPNMIESRKRILSKQLS
tara:strand:- start:1292 stop:1999 length:708 start_codon:yes stop_codon:yes gene_type:complete